MGSLGEWFQGKMNAFAETVGMKKPDLASSVQQAVPAIPAGPDMGLPAEPSGFTSGGGRRLARKGKKTRKGGRRGRKTQRK